VSSNCQRITILQRLQAKSRRHVQKVSRGEHVTAPDLSSSVGDWYAHGRIASVARDLAAPLIPNSAIAHQGSRAMRDQARGTCVFIALQRSVTTGAGPPPARGAGGVAALAGPGIDAGGVVRFLCGATPACCGLRGRPLEGSCRRPPLRRRPWLRNLPGITPSSETLFRLPSVDRIATVFDAGLTAGQAQLGGYGHVCEASSWSIPQAARTGRFLPRSRNELRLAA
jgi:hypothetical protein